MKRRRGSGVRGDDLVRLVEIAGDLRRRQPQEVAMPMTVVSGLLGMNVAGIPFSQNPEAFWFVVVGLALLGTALVWFMRSRKWL